MVQGKTRITFWGLGIFFITILVFSMVFVFAGHFITTSGGATNTSFSVNQTVQYAYNITVNNTDAGQNANITQVNITIPSQFTFTIATNGTNSSADTFSNTTTTSTVLSWSNSTGYVVNGSAKNYFWFNATCETPGTYNFNITTTNATASYNSTLSVTINDTTNPIASFGNPVNNSNSTSSVTFDLKCSDNYNVSTLQLWGDWTGSWVANQTNSSPLNNSYWNVTVSNIPAGAWKWGVYCNDSAGNSNWTTNRTLSIDTTDPIASFGTNPIAAYNDSDGNVTFDIKCSDNLSVSTLQLWSNWSGTWSANYSNFSYTNNTWLNITVAGIPEGGGFVWGVYCNDTYGNSNRTTNRTLIVDKTDPAASPSCTPSPVYVGNTITCSCSGSDSLSGIASTSAGSTPSTSDTGTYYYSCTATDYAGRSATATISYVIEGYGSSGSSGGGSSLTTSFWTGGTYAISKAEFEQGHSMEILAKQRVKIPVEQADHYVGIVSLTDNTATINISSNPQQAIFNIGDNEKFDVTGDNYYDLNVKLTSIKDNKAIVFVQSIHELIPSQTTPEVNENNEVTPSSTGRVTSTSETTNNEKGSLLWLWLGIIILVVVFILITTLYKSKKKRKNYYGF